MTRSTPKQTRRVRPLSENERAILEAAARRLATARREAELAEQSVNELVLILADGQPANYTPGEAFIEITATPAAESTPDVPRASELEATARPSARRARPVPSESNPDGGAAETVAAGKEPTP